MKSRTLIVLLSFLALSGLAQHHDDETPFTTKSLAGQSIQQIEATTAGGNIMIRSADAGKARIDVYVESWKDRHLSKEDLQKKLDEDYTLSISVADNKLTASALHKPDYSNDHNNLSVSFEIFVPGTVSTQLKTSGGNIALSGLTGTQHFSTSGGNVDVKEMNGKMTGHTSGGNIYLGHSKDDMDLRTSGGNIEAEQCSGTIKLITSGGNLTLNDLSGTVTAETSGGNLHADKIEGDFTGSTSGGNLHLYGLSCNLEATGSGGNVEVEMKELRKFVNIDGSNGSIDLKIPSGKGADLKLSGEDIRTANLSNFSGSKGDHSIIGKINGGGTQIDVSAPGGQINLRIE
jgi:hypothetical protein